MISGVGVGRTAEEIGNLVMNREKTLSLPSGLEALHDPLASSGRLMTILRAIVQALMLPMLHAGHHNPLCGGIAGQLVRDHHARSDALLLEQLAQQALGRLCIAAALNQDVEHDAVLVDRASEPMLPACDADHDLIEVPLVSWRRKTSADLVGEALAELHRPLPHRLMTDVDASGCQHLLDHAQAQGKPEIEPDGMADQVSREAVAGVARGA